MNTLINVIKDPEDVNDFIYETPDGLGNIALPPQVDHRYLAGKVEYQSKTSSCVANAAVSCLEILLTKVNAFVDLSRLFLYYNLREPYLNLKGQDKGSYIRDAFKNMAKFGICTEATWPFDIEEINTKPSDIAYIEAAERLCSRYERVQTSIGNYDLSDINKFKYILAKGYPILVSITLAKTFNDISGPLTCHAYPGVQGDKLGGHAMCIVGYDDELSSFIVENSWGSSWGDNGYCAIKYDVLIKDLRDGWVCTEFAGYKFEEEFVSPEKQLAELKTKFEKTGDAYLREVGLDPNKVRS